VLEWEKRSRLLVIPIVNIFALQSKLMRLFPDIKIGGAPEDGSLLRGKFSL
jgi:hypothetical protein